MPKLTIDGVELEAKDGQSVLECALEHGIEIPHFCFHPRLKVAGNCRMCLVEIEKAPKLQIACGTRATEGMVVRTDTEKVRRARRAVMEFLLIQHPLDCPICDECGECRLQDYCFRYGGARSRYRDEKRRFARLNVGPDIVRDMNRCIHCTRCIRFLRDTAGDEEFCLSERGAKAEVGTYLEHPIENPFSLNLAEVCPVGALTSRHFRFKGRSWLMQKVRTLCPGCSRGCNAWAWTNEGKLVRLTPAHNEAVNQCWLCNPGHLTIGQPYRKERLTSPRPQDALEQLIRRLCAAAGAGDGQTVGVAVSGDLANEEIYLVRKLAREVLGSKWLAGPAAVADPRPFAPSSKPLKEWFIRAESAPNARGLSDMLGSTERVELAELAKAAVEGKVKALLVFGDDPRLEEALAPAAGKLELLAVAGARESRLTRSAHLLLPLSLCYEKDGTFTNEAGLVQRLRRVIEPPAPARPAWQWAALLAAGLGAKWNFDRLEQIADEIAAKVPGYAELDLETLSETGLLTGAADSAGQGDTQDARVASRGCDQ